MSDPVTTYKGLAIPVQGSDSGSWGNSLNNGTITPLDLITGGVESIALSSTNYTLNSTDIQYLTVKLSGVLLAGVSVFSANQGFFCVENNCTGNFAVTFQAVTSTSYPSSGSTVGSGIVIPQGVRTWFVSDQTSGVRPCPTWLLTLLLATSGSTLLNLRRTENDGTLRKAISIQSGNGSGNDYSIAETGDSSNNVATVTEQIGSTVIGTKTATAYGFPIAQLLTEIASPSAPASGFMQVYAKSGDVVAHQAPSGIEYLVGKSPTVQPLLTGTAQTYTPTSGTVRIRVRMVGGGAGGAACVTNSGTDGNTTSFQGSAGGFTAWTAVGGSKGITANGAGGIGGTGGTDGTGTKVFRAPGQQGGCGTSGVSNITVASGPGGSSLLGPGAPSARSSNAGISAPANSGGGGSGGAVNNGNSGSGGGGGEYVEAWITIAQLGSTATYTVAASANGGSAGTEAGGNGGSGVIIVEEYYL